MLIYDILDKDLVFDAVTTDLRTLGIKPRVKKHVKKVEVSDKHGDKLKKVFNVSLSHQPLDEVLLSSGATVHVPNFVKQATICLTKHINQEGLFRKAGSQARQKELVNRLDCGNEVGEKYHPVDVANCLKKYFRDLPEPLIPYAYHDLFVRCGMLKDAKVEAILLACLMLPSPHLNTLAFLMDFLNKVSLHESQNRMSIDNLAKVIGPNLMPLRETTISAMQNRLVAHLSIVKILIENSHQIGVLPISVIETIQNELHRTTEIDTIEDRFKEKKKKHRSGSLTRMFNGLRKIVGKNGSPEHIAHGHSHHNHVSDSSHGSPTKSCKKRKNAELSTQLSTIKKKRDSLDGINPTSSARPSVLSTPVSTNPNPERSPVAQKIKTRKYTYNNEQPVSQKPEKPPTKLGLALDRFIAKSRQKINESEVEEKSPKNSTVARRWSMSHSSRVSTKKRPSKNSSTTSLALSPSTKRLKELYPLNNGDCYDRVFMDADVNLSDENDDMNSTKLRRKSSRLRSMLDENLCESTFDLTQAPAKRQCKDQITPEEYVKIPKSEYEAIKNRVSAIESQISQEFHSIVDQNIKPLPIDSASEVQSEYEKTLGEASIESIISADHLARRLSRELKIRRSGEHKVIRSPSARRISSLRRRSQEKPASVRKRQRRSSWHISDKSETSELIPTSQLRSEGVTADLFCSEATNARLDYLHRQLCTLISHTAEHTGDHRTNQEQLSRVVKLQKSSANVRRASSFHGNEIINGSLSLTEGFSDLRKTNSQQHIISDGGQIFNYDSKIVEIRQKNLAWKDADVYLETNSPVKTPICTPISTANQTGRASVAKLRTQNAGMVLAKAKLFDLNDSKNNQDSTELPKKKPIQRGSKDVKTTPEGLRKKKCKSPKNGVTKSKLSPSPNSSCVASYTRHQSLDRRGSYRHTFDQRNRHLSDESPLSNGVRKLTRNASDCTGRPETNIITHVTEITSTTTVSNTPHIKKPLGLKTPKSARSLARRPPVDSRRTPLKAVPTSMTPKRQSPRNVLKSRQLSRHVN